MRPPRPASVLREEAAVVRAAMRWYVSGNARWRITTACCDLYCARLAARKGRKGRTP